LAASGLENVYVHAPAVQGAVPFSVPAPVSAIATVPLSPAAVPHAPPTVVTVTLIDSGNVRAVPFTVVNVTTGIVRSTLIVCGPVVPMFAAASLWVTVIVYAPSAESAVVGVNVHVPAVHGAVPFCVLVPLIATETVAASPIAAPHVPPKAVTVALLRYGKVRAVPFTDVSATCGSVLSTVMLCAPLVPVLPAVSDCVIVTEYTPSVASAVPGVNVQAFVVQAAVPFWLLAPVIAIETVGFTPAAVVQTPPIVVTVAFVMNGKVRAVPFTVASVTVGAAVLIVIETGAVVVLFVAVSDCVAVIE
jgi:hypothetical protein